MANLTKNHRLWFVLSLVFALAAAVVAAAGYSSVVREVPVVIAARDMVADEVVTPQSVAVGKIPRGAVQGDTVTDPKDLQGWAAKGFVPAGTVLRKSMFQPVAAAGTTARLSLYPGRVALALDGNTDTTVGGSIKAGDRVAVKAVSKTECREVASGAVILSAPSRESKAVVLAVTPAEADAILSARAANSIVAFQLLPVQVKQ